jgi:hypothetical protein
MMATVRRLVGAERSSPPPGMLPEIERSALERPVEQARERSEAANRDHEASVVRVAEVTEQIRAATEAFDADGSEEAADRLVDLKRELERRQLFSQRTQRAAVAAAGAVEEAGKERDATLLKHLDERSSTAPARIQELWWERGAPALQRLGSVVSEINAIINDSIAASSEAHRLRGTRNVVPPAMASDALKSVLLAAIERTVDPPTLVKLRRLLGP